MPLARNRISGEAWFAIANQMLAHDAYQNEQRGSAAGPPRAASQRLPQRPSQFAGKDHSLPMVN